MQHEVMISKVGFQGNFGFKKLKKMELNPEQASEEESSQGGVSDTDDVGSVSVPVDDEGFETLAAEIKEVLAELAQVFTFSFVVIIIRLLTYQHPTQGIQFIWMSYDVSENQ